ncbi:hypothetical protein DYB26_001322 [Aphanomyces astaci]|uniref:Protein kinase domain-containing protein n=1 Tax=Aphanomyces astaci TaxID=112090 RepID=A0A418CUS6_APHAT|nr:hypothetical protein DYB26_001322 [Aphanomyces astaci]
MLPLARAAAVVVWALCACIRAADECSLPKSLLTVKCGHVVAVDSKTKICPFDPASCSVFVPGDCFDATGANQLAVFDTVDAANPSPFDAVPNAKSLTELGAVCFDRQGKDTGSVVLLRAERFCVVDTNCQPQPYTSESKGTAQVLLDLKRAGENSASPAINLNLEALGPDLSVDGFNQTLTNVVTLLVANNNVNTLDGIKFPSNMTSISFKNNSLQGTVDASALPSSLETINLSGTPIQNGELNVSLLPPSLVALYVTMYHHQSYDECAYVYMWGRDVSNCGIKKVTGDLPPSLRSLRLDKNDLETWVVSSTTYKALMAMPDLVLPATSVFKCPESGTKYIKHFPVCRRRDERGSIMSKSDPMDQDMSTFDFVHLGTSKRHDLGDEFNQFRIPMREINIINPLVDQGDYLAGARTMLYKAQFNERLVVLKTLTTEGTEVSDAAAAFVQHIRLRSTLDHPNIVGFLGIVWGNRAKMAVTGYGLMLEFVGHGDLARLLAFDATKDPTDRLLQWRPLVPANVSKLALLQQVASAIVYLHSFSPPVTHRNIQAKSVLLTETWDAKLSGFETDPSWIPSDLISPPEVLRGEAWTEKADIYAFGILICELDLGRHPYVNDKNPANNSQIATLVKADLLQPTFSVECPLEVQDIATKCLHFDRKSRPAGVEMEFWLRKLVRTTAV